MAIQKGDIAMSEKKKMFNFDWDKISTDIKKSEEKKSFDDDRFWKLSPDEKGEALAIIRFLPTLDGSPFVRYFSHNFSYQKDGQLKWYNDKCVNSLGFDKNCPICVKNKEYKSSAYQKDKDIASDRKCKVAYVANIYIVKNPNNPEQEGNVFLYKYGTKIHDKINQKWFPSPTDLQDPDFKQFIPFHLYEGANFKLKGMNLNIKANKKGVFANYDTSEFSTQSEFLNGDDTKIEEVMNKTYSLNEFIDEKTYPTNEKVLTTLACILSNTKNESITPEYEKVYETDVPDFTSVSTKIDDDEEFFNLINK